MKMLVANIFTISGAVVILIFGIAYFYKSASVNNHCNSIRQNLEELSVLNRTFIFALMRGVAGGAITFGITTIFLQLQYSKHGQRWIPLIILISSSIYFITSLNAMILAKRKTTIKPPIILLLLAVFCIVVGYFINEMV